MSEQITSQEFWAEVSSIANSVITEYEHDVIMDIDNTITELARVEEPEELGERVEEIIQAIDDITVDDLDDVGDRLHEIVDGHEWVIYYHHAWSVAYLVQGDDNACVMFEELGYIQPGESLGDLICQFAHCALYSNASENMSDALERWKASKKAEVRAIVDRLQG